LIKPLHKNVIFFLKKLSQNTLVHSVSLLMSGNMLGQLVMLLSLPVITRLFSPNDISLLAVYIAIMSIISIGGCLRFEIAIPIPENDKTAANLTALALISSLMTAVLIVIILFVIWLGKINIVVEYPLWNYAWLFPIGTIFAGLYATMSYWSIRKQRYYLVGKTRVIQMTVGSITQIGSGLMGSGYFGLLLGHLLMTSAGFFGLVRSAWINDRYLLREISYSELRKTFIAYKNFPKFSVAEGLATTGAQQLAIILISLLVSGEEVAFFFIAIRVLQAPVSLVTNAVSKVYLQRSPMHLRNGTLRKFTNKFLLYLGGICSIPCMLFGYYSVEIFELVFGAEWARAGKIAIVLLPMVIISLLSASIATILNVTGQQQYMLRLKLAGFTLRVGSILVASYLAPQAIIETYAVVSAMVFAMYLLSFYSASK
jgi:O-antigen/teichoic acid export membrane protein